MKGKIAPILFGGLALAGLLLAMVGFVMGGRPGAVTVRDGNFVFLSGGETIPLGQAPDWFGENWLYGVGFGGEPEPVPTPSVPASGQNQALPFAELSQLRGFELDVKGAHVYLTTGAEASLQVEGPLPFESVMDNGVWTIATTHSYRNLVLGGEQNGLQRVLQNGQDVTTIFTITLPRDLNRLDIEVRLGSLHATDISARAMEISLDAGRIEIYGGQADTAVFDVDAGAIIAAGFLCSRCEMDVDAGAIEYEGDIAQRLEADCDAGSIEMQLARPGRFGWETDVGAGSIAIGGQNYGTLFEPKSSGNAGAEPFYDLECDAGSINIVFLG